MPLPRYFWQIVDTFIAEDGFHQHGVTRNAKGENTLINVNHINPPMVHVVMAAQIGQPGVREVIYGLDRFVLPNQPAETQDIVTAAWWRRGRGWKFGVISYRPEPDKIVLPWDWGSTFWNTIMRNEMKICVENREAILDEARRNSGE